MRLSSILFRRNTLPNGHIFRGKDRLVKKVEPVHIRRVREDFEREEKNMFYLRFPYLTEAQSFGHAKALGKSEKRMNKLKEYNQRIFKDDVTVGERLLHLRVTESWDS